MLAAGTTAWAQSNPQRAAVTGLSATSGSNPGEIDVSWDAHPAGAVDYRVAWKPVGERFRPASDTDWNANPTATGMTIAGLTEGSDYKVKVRARFDSNPRSRWSSVATATASSPPEPPPPVIQPPEPTPPLETAESHLTGPLPWTGHNPQDIQDRQSGQITSSADQVWYRLALGARKLYKLEYHNRHGKNLVNQPKLTVYDNAGNVLMKHGEPVASERVPRSESYWKFVSGIGYVQQARPGGYFNPRLYFIPELNGPYYLKVNSVVDDTGHFDIWYRLIDTIDKGDRTGPDCKETFDSTCSIWTVSGEVEGKFHPKDRCTGTSCNHSAWDNDRYWMYLEYGATYTLCLVTGGDNRGNHTQDGFSSPNGDFDHAWAPGCIDVTPQFRTRAYEVALGGRDLAYDRSETRDYILKYKIITSEADRIGFVPEGNVGSTSEPAGEDLPNDSETTIGYVQPNGLPATANISTVGDVDWFKTRLTAGHKYRFDVKGSEPSDPGGTLDDPYLSVYLPDGLPIGSDDESGEGKNPRLEFTASITGNHKIRVQQEGSYATGTYTVTVKRID